MIRIKTGKKFKLVAFFMSFIILLACVMPIAMSGRAEDTKIIYFDTSCTGQDGSNHGWSKSMSTVYYYAYNSSGNSGIHSMTNTGKSGTNGGIIHSASISSSYSTIIFLSESQWKHSGSDDYRWQTKNIGIPSDTASKVFILGENGYTDNDTQPGTSLYKQDVYTKTKPAESDHGNEKFSIMNMTNSSVTIKVRYSYDIKNSDGTWTDVSKTKSDFKMLTMDPRTYYYNSFTVPTMSDPYTAVEICNSNEVVINRYYFDEGKIIGRTYYYGLTQFNNGSLVCYQDKNKPATNAVNEKLYLSKDSFALNNSPTVAGVATTQMTTGNAHYVTNSDISVSAFTPPTGDTEQTINLSSNIFSVVYNGNTYNLFGPEIAGDNLICINTNVATVAGTYTVQSTKNVLKEGDKTYNYITTQADFYDYQYDHNSSDSSYTYKVNNLLFTNNKGWSHVYAYFFNDSGGVNGSIFPGTEETTKYKKNEYSQDIYVISIPTGAKKVIFSDGTSSNQTNDITLNRGTITGYYISSDSNRYNVGTYNATDQANSGDKFGILTSERGNAKRPYLAINEKISASDYAATSTNYPMYLGQFWLKRWTDNSSYDESKEIYNSSTTGQRAAHNDDDDYYPMSGAGAGDYAKGFGFGNTLTNFNWSANLAYRDSTETTGAYKPYNGVVQGLVNKQLENSEYLKSNSGSQYIPYFDMRNASQGGFWTGNFATSQGTTVNMADYIVKAENRAFPFFETQDTAIQFKNDSELNRGHKTGDHTQMLSDTGKNYTGTYYVFDSSKNTVRVDGDSLDIGYNNTNKQVWDNYGTGLSGSDSEIGLFPFNEKNDGGHNSQKLHYGFGVKFSIDFYLNDHGTLDGTKTGTPITFTFQGDDDVWVFLDDQLILDMGGAHKNAVGEINFANKMVYIDSGTKVNTEHIQTTGLTYIDEPFSQFNSALSDSSSYLKTGKHKITMYYLERGMLNSNLYVMFNLPMSLTKWELQEDTDFSNVNTAFVNATRAVANQDVFNYKVENAGTKTVVGSDYKYPSNDDVTRNNQTETSNTAPVTKLSSAATNVTDAQTYNYKGSEGTAYVPLIDKDGGGVSYGLRDMFAGNNTAIFRTRTMDSDQGVVSLQYGELATFSKQFNYQTAMRVTQLEKLSAPESNYTRVTDAGADSYNDSTGRTSSKYYTTYWRSVPSANDYTRDAGIYRGNDIAGLTISNASGIEHATNMYNTLVNNNKNYSQNSVVNLQPDGLVSTYNFNDPLDGADEYVHLRQVVINKVKTADLRISKRYLVGNADDTSYSFNIHFSNVFGSTLGDSLLSITSVKYHLNGLNTETPLGSDGSFSLKPDEYIIIKDIPVGTKFYITEQSNSSDTYVLDENMSVNLGSQTNPVEITDDTESVAINARKTGKFAISKILYGTDGTTQITNDTTQFTLTVTLTQPSGVNLSDYIIMVNGLPVTLTRVGETNNYTFTTQITGGQSFYVNGLPYNTVYSVTEDDPPSGYKKLDTGHIVYSDTAKTIGNTTQENDTVTVKNQLNPIIMPSTGGTPFILLFPFGIIAIVISAGALVIYKRRLQYKTVIK